MPSVHGRYGDMRDHRHGLKPIIYRRPEQIVYIYDDLGADQGLIWESSLYGFDDRHIAGGRALDHHDAECGQLRSLRRSPPLLFFVTTASMR